ncbi:MAG: N-acetyl-alpha-D-glucosaminyl L-malate synthase BshA [Planctomycetota bacterium]
MKIAIACHPTFGGSGVVASELGMELAKRDHDVHFVSYQPPFRVDQHHDRVHVHEVEVTSYPLFKYPPYALALATKLMEVVRANDVHLLHAHYAIPHSISALLARQMCRDCNLRVITTLHGTDITLVGADHSFYEVTRYGIEESDAVTAVSDDLAAETRREFGIEKPIHVVPNFIDPDVYSPTRRNEALRQSYVTGDEALMIHVSNFRPVKRPIDVVRIFSLVAKDVPARLLMVGTGPELAAAKEEAARLEVCDRVIFAGAVVGVAELLASSDLLLLPSDSESFGLAALEAMACGTPVVGTCTGGLPEVVEDGASGALEPVGDVQAMAMRAVEILGNQQLLRQMGEAARQRAVTKFPASRVVEQYVQIYEEVLATRD